MSSREYELVRQAIQSKMIVTAWYNGHYRELCPHVLGWKDGREHGFFYQFGGTSSKGLRRDSSDQNWRCMDIDKLYQVTVRPGTWHSAPVSYRRGQQMCVDEVDLAVPVLD